MENNKILIVGGYGAVGRIIAIKLGSIFQNQVIVAGRNYQKAKELSINLDRKVIPLELDITSISIDDERLSEIKIVIVCIDQKNIKFVKECIRQGIHYIDVSASYEFLSKIELLNSEARNYSSTVVLSVGLIPGLTNLLAKLCKSKIKDMKYADIYVMLGLGESHGEAAIRWTLENINTKYFITDFGEKIQVSSFENGKHTIFPDNIGKRTAYRLNFSDQHVIPRTLEINSASSWLCFDSKIITLFIAVLKKTGLSKIFDFKPIQNFLIRILKVSYFGSKQFIVKVEARNSQKEEVLYECSLSGEGEAKITALVAAQVAEFVLKSKSVNGGVFHIEQLINPLEFIENLKNVVSFEESILK
ncbi:MAG: Saccharopine dehydrogenase [Calditrichaeota bacterium]|nr:MAG: Saccharopine dehydrogenase [Calditrichota bacterium]MBL1207232.1 Saccharopine dehydrogenase [Calditrichota bacterium]NOG47065.1 Saccharopine dehydrogenase [Calditrichota bacterium]